MDEPSEVELLWSGDLDHSVDRLGNGNTSIDASGSTIRLLRASPFPGMLDHGGRLRSPTVMTMLICLATLHVQALPARAHAQSVDGDLGSEALAVSSSRDV